MMKTIIYGALGAALLLGAACSSQNQDDLGITLAALTDNSLTNSTEERNLPGYYLSTILWTSNTISVCWETSGYASKKTQVKDWVEAAWERQSNINFTGWGNCTSAYTNIRIIIEDVSDAPHTLSPGGNTIDNVTSGMSLNFTFNNWCGSGCKDDMDNSIKSIALHEFGHALGISHEHNRSDRASDCNEATQGTNGDTTVGIFDRYSIMNYCYESSYNGKLSAGDIMTIQTMYGKTVTVNKEISMIAAVNSKYARVNVLSASKLYPNIHDTNVDNYTKFDLVSNSDGTYSFKSKGNNDWLKAAKNDGGKLKASHGNHSSSRTRFYITVNSDGSLSLKNKNENQYVRARSAGDSYLIADANAIGGWEKFFFKYHN